LCQTLTGPTGRYASVVLSMEFYCNKIEESVDRLICNGSAHGTGKVVGNLRDQKCKGAKG